jgi:hypothetical protein
MTERMLTAQKGEMGLGIIVRGEADDLWFTHSGGNEGFRCIMIACPEKGQGAAIMTNGDLGSDLFIEILRSIAAEYGWKSFQPLEKEPATIDPSLLKKLAGTYQFSPVKKMEIIPEKGHLLADSVSAFPWGNIKCEFYPESETVFFAIQTEAKITFEIDEEGKIAGLVLKQGEFVKKATKVN